MSPRMANLGIVVVGLLGALSGTFTRSGSSALKRVTPSVADAPDGSHRDASHPDSTSQSTRRYRTARDLIHEFTGDGPLDRGRPIKIIVVSIPDPISSHLDWSYDAELESVRRAFEQRGFVIDRYWLPWHGREDTTANRLGLADLMPGSDHPGVLLFRARNPGDDTLGLAYLVGEVPTLGVWNGALRAALDERRLLLDSLRDADGSSRVLVVGPAFSGSSRSLRRVLAQWRQQSRDTSAIEIVTGSASDPSNARVFAADTSAEWRHVAFHATVHTSAQLEAVAESIIVHRLHVNPSEIAFLHEGTTQFGQGGDTAQKTQGPLRIAFPMNISSLRVQYGVHPQAPLFDTEGTTLASPVVPRLPLDLREPAALTESPGVLSLMTPAATELLMTELERTLSTHHVRVIGILATDVRDQLFVADELRHRLRDVQVFFYGSNVLLLRPEYRHALVGSLVLSTYPLILENQYWDLTRPLFDTERLAFMSDEAEGVFNATLAQLGKPEAMRDYVLPLDTTRGLRDRRPPVWITVVGVNTMYPVTIESGAAEGTRQVDTSYVLGRKIDITKIAAEQFSHSRQFGFALFLLAMGFAISYAVMQHRTAARLDPVVAWPLKWKKPEKGARKDATRDVNDEAYAQDQRRTAHWASLLLHRELYVLLRFFAWFAVFAATLLVMLRPKAHGILTPTISIAALTVLAIFAAVVVAMRGILQSAQVLRLSLDCGIGWFFRAGLRRRQDRVLWFVEVVCRFSILFVGLFYFVLFLTFIWQVLRLPAPASAFFFQRAVALGSGLSPAVPLMLSAAGFAMWSTWHLTRIGLLSEPTTYEDFLLRRAEQEAGLKEAQRVLRDRQKEVHRYAREAVRLARESDKSHSWPIPARLKTDWFARRAAESRIHVLTRAEAAAMMSEAAATDAQGLAEQISSRLHDRDRRGSALQRLADAEMRSSHSAAAFAAQSVELARNEFDSGHGSAGYQSLRKELQALDPAPQPERLSGGNGHSDAANSMEQERTNSSRRIESFLLYGRSQRGPWFEIARAYHALARWVDFRRRAQFDRRSAAAAQSVNDALFYLVPSYGAIIGLTSLVVVGVWVGLEFQPSIESIVLSATAGPLSFSAFDALFRVAVIGGIGTTIWAIYRLLAVWSGMRTVLEEVEPDLLPACRELPARLARVTRLTPFGQPSRSDLELVVQEKWRRLEAVFLEFPRSDRSIPELVGDLASNDALCATPEARLRPYDLEPESRKEFMRLDQALSRCRDAGLISPATAPTKTETTSTRQDSGVNQLKRRWAEALCGLYAVYLADYADWVFQHLRYLAAFLLVSLVLTVVLLSSYPFQPQGTVKAIYFVVVAAAVVTITTVIVQTDKDPVLSAINDTPSGAISWDARFIGNILTYGVIPMLTIVSTEFPSVRDFLFSWITPLARLFTH